MKKLLLLSLVGVSILEASQIHPDDLKISDIDYSLEEYIKILKGTKIIPNQTLSTLLVNAVHRKFNKDFGIDFNLREDLIITYNNLLLDCQDATKKMDKVDKLIHLNSNYDSITLRCDDVLQVIQKMIDFDNKENRYLYKLTNKNTEQLRKLRNNIETGEDFRRTLR